ncbi:MAG: tripartite tricarboxylate transporter substrate binding protein [Spirochaetales bacterium]|nr:tripartite tricarboxylate transporter substrate binding protein [Spirochaetales bacterium]
MRQIIRMALVVSFVILLTVPVFATGAGEGLAGKPPAGPGDTIEFVCGYNPGGGSDIMLRSMEKAIRTHNIIPNPILYTYKPGATAGISLQFTKTQAGRSDLALAVVSSLILTPLQNDVGAKREDLTDLANFGVQYFFIWAHKETAEREGWKTINDVLKSNRPVTITNHGAGSVEEIIGLYIKSRAPNTDIRLVPVAGDPEGVTQLLGKHIDLFINELAGGGIESYIASGEIVPLGCTGPQRSVFVPDVPTFKELGHDFTIDSFRGVMGPPNMSKEALAWWQDIMKKINETDTWQEYLRANGIEPMFQIGSDFSKYLDGFKEGMVRLFKMSNIPMVPNP